jgi:hypothetical protein
MALAVFGVFDLPPTLLHGNVLEICAQDLHASWGDQQTNGLINHGRIKIAHKKAHFFHSSLLAASYVNIVFVLELILGANHVLSPTPKAL